MKTVCIFSGGMDSATLLTYLVNQTHDVLALSVNYGQRHRKELQYAERFADDLGVHWTVADLSSITPLLASSQSSLVSDSPVPHGHYAAENMKATVVPNRNMIMLSVAAGYAIANEARAVAYGAHAGDHTIYPDCRYDFGVAMDKAFRLCDWQEIELLRPFVGKSKADIVTLGTELGVDYSKTWSCYEGQELHCGACGTCVERREAFQLAGVSDPTIYRQEAPELDAILHATS